MPEIISKYPEITLKVLKEAGARCGPEFQPRILTQCPPERFCSLPTGEICVYGIDEIPETTQISQQEILQALSQKAPLPIERELDKELFFVDWLGIFLALFVGTVLGLIISKTRKKFDQNKF